MSGKYLGLLVLLAACGHDAGAIDAGQADLSTARGPDAPDGGTVLLDLGGDPYGIYDRAGPYAVTRSSAAITHGTKSYMVEVHLTDAPGPRPVVLLAPGLLQHAIAYRPYAERLASHGVIVFVRDDPGLFVDTTVVTDDLVDLATSYLPDANAGSGPLAGRLDLARLGLAGHSRGGKASVMAAEGGLHGKLRGWFGLDPVDSSVLAAGATARDGIGAIGIPTAFMGAEVSSTCSPAGDNYTVLFAAATSPSVALTGVGAGHTQLQDAASCVSCNLCTPAGTADGAVVLHYAVRYLTAFFARELLGDASVGPSFDGAGAQADVALGLVTRMAK